MKANLKKLLAVAIAAYSGSAFTLERGLDTNLTHVKFKDWYSPYAMTGGTGSLMHCEDAQREDSLGACVSVMGFYERVLDGTRGSQELAKGFGVDGSRVVRLAALTADTEGSVDSRNLIHGHPTAAANPTTSIAEAAKATITLDAAHRRMGAQLCYAQDLSNFYEGLKFTASSAVLSVRNELKADFSDVSETTSGATVKVRDFLYGNGEDRVGGTSNHNRQAALRFAKFANKEQTDTYLNDIQLSLGMNVVDSENTKISVGAVGVIPTGKELKGEFLMEPQVGNRHFKAGMNVHANACLAEGTDYKACLNLCGTWHYGFKRENVRLASFKTGNWNHYALGFRKGSANGAALEPVINLLPKKVDVCPRSMFNASADLAFEKGSFVVDAGYSFFYSQDEKNEVKGFVEGDIFIADKMVSTAGTLSDVNGTVVRLSDLSYSAKSQALHHIFGSLGLICKEWQYPASLNLAGGYEVAHNRTRTREVWSVALKGAICF